MKPSSFKSSAMRTFSFEEGMSTFSCSARLPLRIRVNMSPIGSVTIAISRSLRRASPGSLDHARDLAPERQAAETDPAELELPEVASRPPAQPAARVPAHLELGRPLLLHDQRRLGHTLPPERDAEVHQQRLRLFVAPRGGAHDHVHPADLVDLVVHDLGEDDLLPEPQ